MKKALLLSITLVFILAHMVIAAEEYDFRKVNWGMSPAEIKEIETAGGFMKLDTGEYSYETKVAGYDAFLYYVFADKKLAQADYILLIEHINDNLYIEDYNNIKELLIHKYGQPQSDELIWKDETYKGKRDKYGTALAIGDLEYTSKWDTDSTLIDCWLYGDNFEVTLGISYYSKELFDTLLEIQKEADMENL